jgi:hypothetical protein
LYLFYACNFRITQITKEKGTNSLKERKRDIFSSSQVDSYLKQAQTPYGKERNCKIPRVF